MSSLTNFEKILTDTVDRTTPEEDILKAYIEYTDLNAKRIIGAGGCSMPSKYTEEECLSRCTKESDDTMSTQDNIISVSTGDNSMSAKDITVSTHDIFETSHVYSWSVDMKRKYGDDGEWWLPSQWRSSTRARWPSSAYTSRRRRGG